MTLHHIYCTLPTIPYRLYLTDCTLQTVPYRLYPRSCTSQVCITGLLTGKPHVCYASPILFLQVCLITQQESRRNTVWKSR